MSQLALTPVETAACCSPLLREPLSADQADRLAPLLKALADPVRLRLVSIVAASEGGEACVCDLNDAFDLSQPTISHHLKVLHDAGLLDRDQARRVGLLRRAPRGPLRHRRPHRRHRVSPVGATTSSAGSRPSTASCPLWIGLAMVAGLLLGRTVSGLGDALSAVEVDGISLPIAIGLLVMMYPVLAKVRYDRLDSVTSDRRLLVASLVLNWVVGPALMFALAWLLLPDLPEYRTGLIIVGLARCIAMVHHLERPRLRRPRGRGRAGRAQLGLPGHRLRRPRLVLPRRSCPAGSASTAPRSTSRRGRSPSPCSSSSASRCCWACSRARFGERIRGREWYESAFLPRIGPWALIGLLFTIVVLFALQGEQITSQPARRGPDRAAAAGLLRPHVGRRLPARPRASA